ncbi:MAG TPA: YdcF family protein [Gemmatimonadaceae bacterium]|nr:YdcF family protein [Gemmatimonadaceae bacterium]
MQQLLRIPDLALYVPAAIFGALVGPTRLRPLVWVPAGIIAAICIAVAYTPVVSMLARPLIRRDALPTRVDAVAVLAMGLTPDGMMRSETLDRLLTGLALAKRGLAPAMLVSRERRDFTGELVSDSADLQNVATLANPAARVIFVDSVVTTRTEAIRMEAIARANHWSTLAVVTSPMHTRRACATFEAVGLRVVCIPAAVRGSGLYPGANAEDRLRAFRSWLYEVFASSSYKSRAWIR